MKKKLQVKRLFTAVAFAVAATGMTSAQKLSYEGNARYMQPIPASLTVDGKERIAVGGRSSGIDIYNKNLVKETTISMAPQELDGEDLTQEATVTVTGATIYSYSGSPFGGSTIFSYYNEETETYEDVTASSLEEGLEKLKSLYPNYSDFKIYNIDNYSFIFNAATAASSAYYLYDLFGTKYPLYGTYYVCRDGYLFSGMFDFSSNVWQRYDPLYDESSAVWTTRSRGPYGGTTIHTEECYYINADGNSQFVGNFNDSNNMGLYVTQNFFNDDDEWEYVVPMYEETEFVSSASVDDLPHPDGTVTLKRHVYKEYEKTGYRVVSQNGGVLLSLSFPTVLEDNPTLWTINGKNYIQIQRCKTEDYRDGYITELYAIEGGSSNVRKVLEHEAELSSFIIPEGQQIRILLGEGEGESDVVLTSASGQMVFSQHVGAGVTSATVSTTSLAKGVYVVSVSRGGRVLRSQKIKI